MKYAKLIELAQDARLKYPSLQLNSVAEVTCAQLLGEMADALTAVCRQNRNLRHDLMQTKRDYRANLEELLRVNTKLDNLKEELAGAKRRASMDGWCKFGDLLPNPFGGRKKLQLEVPGLLVTPSAEDEDIQYVDLGDGLRLLFDRGKYTGWYLPGGGGAC